MPTNPPSDYRRRGLLALERTDPHWGQVGTLEDTIEAKKEGGGDREKEKESQNERQWQRLLRKVVWLLHTNQQRPLAQEGQSWSGAGGASGAAGKEDGNRCLSSSRSCASLAQSGNTTNSNRVWCSFDQLDHVVFPCITVVGLIIIDGLNSLLGLITIFRLLYKPWDISENLNSIITYIM